MQDSVNNEKKLAVSSSAIIFLKSFYISYAWSVQILHQYMTQGNVMTGLLWYSQYIAASHVTSSTDTHFYHVLNIHILKWGGIIYNKLGWEN